MNKNKIYAELYESVSQNGLIAGIRSVFGRQGKIRLGFSKKICYTDIEEIELSVRTYNALKRNGVNTLGDAIDALNDGRLMNFRNLGLKSYVEVKTKIIDYGYNALNENEKKAFLADIVEINVNQYIYGPK